MIAHFCQLYHLNKLSIFCSVLLGDFTEQSDVDILVEFHSEHILGLISFAEMEQGLSQLLGHKVDFRTAEDISHYFRQQVLESAYINMSIQDDQYFKSGNVFS